MLDETKPKAQVDSDHALTTTETRLLLLQLLSLPSGTQPRQ